MKVLIACEESQRVCIALGSAGMRRTAAIYRTAPAAIPNGISRATRSKPYAAELSPPATERAMILANGTCSSRIRHALIYQTSVRAGYTLTKGSWIWRDTARGLQRKRFSWRSSTPTSRVSQSRTPYHRRFLICRSIRKKSNRTSSGTHTLRKRACGSAICRR